jgi:hypothetical protein
MSPRLFLLRFSLLRRAVLVVVPLVVFVLGGGAGCRAFPGHPVRLSQPRLEQPVGVAAEAAAAALPQPSPLSDAEVETQLFLQVERLYANLLTLREQSAVPADPRTPAFTLLPSVEASVRERFAGKTVDGLLRHAVAIGTVGTVPLPPSAMADLLMDPETERQVLAAATCHLHRTEFALPGARRAQLRIEMLNMGFGPMRYDLRFTVVFERRDLADGRILLRYDLGADPAPEHVTLYRGACLIEPSGTGSKMSEIIILGTDIQVPALFSKGLRNLVVTTLRNRVTNLWVRAWR